jgi:HEAT repeat protein
VPGDDDVRMDALVLRVAMVVLALSLPAWILLSLVVVLGRARYEHRRRQPNARTLGTREADRLVRRVSRNPRTEWGKWRRVTALARLEQTHHPAVPRLIRLVLADPDPRIATAAVRTLGDIGDEWAIDVLISALHKGVGPRSRVAAELERLAPAPGEKLISLLRDWNPAVRFWGASLLGPYPDLGESTLIALTWDSDPNVRAAAVETLGNRSGAAVGAATLACLEDSQWFVRVHAARAAGHVLGAAAAPTIARHLSEEWWWVRTAAKDALRALGTEAVPSLLAMLTHDDPFARNGAAEVLQDIGFVDFLALDDPRSPLLERIYEAGGERLRDATQQRIAVADQREAQVA